MHPILVYAFIALLGRDEGERERLGRHYRLETGGTLAVFVVSPAGACGPLQVLPWVADGIRQAERASYRGSVREKLTCIRLMVDPAYAVFHGRRVDRAAMRTLGPSWKAVRCGYVHGPYNNRCGHLKETRGAGKRPRGWRVSLSP